MLAISHSNLLKSILKHLLVKNRIKFPKTHDLLELLDKCKEIDKDFEKLEKYENVINEISEEVKKSGWERMKDCFQRKAKSGIYFSNTTLRFMLLPI